MTLRQRQPRFESPALLRLARQVPCQFTFPHKCSPETMACHSNGLSWGKGVGLKSHDCFFASGCFNAHDAIDNKLNKTLSQDERQYYWLEAFISTWTYIWSNRMVKIA